MRFARLKVPPSLPRFLRIARGSLCADRAGDHRSSSSALPRGRARRRLVVPGHSQRRYGRRRRGRVDLLEVIELELRRRRFGRAIRLEVDGEMPVEARQLLQKELDLEADDVFGYDNLLDLTGYWQLVDLDRADLKTPSVPAVTPRRLREIEDSRDFFRRIQRSDVIFHHPYESFSASVSEFIRQASLDPGVLAIKLTLYRTSGDSPIIESLIRAAEQGKQVAALVELKARFDEEANISWARSLEEAGVHVVYGLARAEDPYQDRSRRARRARWHTPVLPCRHRQLQPRRRHASTKTLVY